MRKRESMTPLFQVHEGGKGGLPAPLSEEIMLRPGNEHKVDSVLKIRNCSSTVDPGRRGVHILAGSEEMPLFQESFFFGKDEGAVIEYLGREILLEAACDSGIRLKLSF